jgi:hypothetical protein
MTTKITVELNGNVEIAYEILKGHLENHPPHEAYNISHREMVNEVDLEPKEVYKALNLAERIIELEPVEEKKEEGSVNKLVVYKGVEGIYNSMIFIEGDDEATGRFILMCEYLKKNKDFPLCKKNDNTYEFLTTDLSYVKSLSVIIATQLEYPITFTFDK